MAASAEQERPTIEWINSLSPDVANDLLDWIETVRGPVVAGSSRASSDVSCMVKLNDTVPGSSGADWSNWVTCRILPRRVWSDWSTLLPVIPDSHSPYVGPCRASEKRHRRIQINFAVEGASVITPAKERSQGAQLKRILPPASWDGLKNIANLTTGGRAQVKIWAHHVACRANGKVASNTSSLEQLRKLMAPRLLSGSRLCRLCR